MALRIGVYALAKNVAGFVDRWEQSCREADFRIVTDTGSEDDTVDRLQSLGVAVVRSSIVPWRWDDAHTQSLNNLPADVDVCIRLDLDETLVPGWRPIVEAYFSAGDQSPHKLTHRYEWGPGVQFSLDRVHVREGYRWTGATHEGLVRWRGEAAGPVSPDHPFPDPRFNQRVRSQHLSKEIKPPELKPELIK
jgi:hypothetical protein